MKDDFPDYARGILKDMKNTIKDMKNKDEAQKQYDALEEKFKDALKKQEQIKGKVSKIDDHKLSQKLGMNNKNVQVNKNHVQKAPVNELQKGHTY